VPLVVGGVIVGSLSCSTLRRDHAWPEELVQRLRLIGEVFANALARRRAEGRIRESEERFRLMADSAPWMVWMSDPDGTRTYFNSGWLDTTGRRLEDELGEGWSAAVHPDDRERGLVAVREAAAAHRPFTLEYRLQRWDGEYRWILDHGLPRLRTDGVMAGYVGSATDITELKAAQQVVLESSALRGAIFGSLHGHAAALDRRGVIVAVNESWLRFAAENGADPALVSVGAPYLDGCRRAAAMDEGDGRTVAAAITAVLEGRSEHGQVEYLCHTPAGARWFEMVVEPLRRPEGGALVLHVNVTRRRHAEDLAHRQREELARTLRATALGQVATSLAHEVNQPLAAIVANAQATLHVLDASLRPDLRDASDVRETLEDIAADAKRASEIIHRLGGVLRKEPATSPELGVNQMVEHVLGLLGPELGRKGITVLRAYHPNLPPVSGDPVQLQEVLLSLLVNASEAISAAGDGPRDITVGTAVREPGLVEIAIGDTGIGVEEAEMERIFERFVSRKQDGLGMGLATSRSVIQAHGGRIWATRSPRRGLTVHVALPIAHRTFVQ
jgi:PAS domain S-box-containing protein